MMAIAAVAPNILGAMGKLGVIPRKRQKEFIEASRERLVSSGFLEYKQGMLSITHKGRVYLLKETSFWKIKKSKQKWDGKWRVLIFDIPEKRKATRDQIRITLSNIGFMRLQDSVWIYPYDCADLITLLKADLKIGRNVLYMIVEALEYDKPVRSYFELAK
jgi:DNA-binding transcriptional regulator PaaX